MKTHSFAQHALTNCTGWLEDLLAELGVIIGDLIDF
jgi:hypothetical protein